MPLPTIYLLNEKVIVLKVDVDRDLDAAFTTVVQQGARVLIVCHLLNVLGVGFSVPSDRRRGGGRDRRRSLIFQRTQMHYSEKTQ